jgi:peroxiredoxin
MKKSILFVMFLGLVSIIAQAQIADKPEDISPLLVGESLPNETLVNLNNEPIELYSVLKVKPTVLVFYRGGWCPYCNAQLSALAQSESEILKLGYQIVAISPEDYQNLQPTIAKDSIRYQVYSDPNGILIQKMGLAYKTKDVSKFFISPRTKGDVSELLPVPAVMIVNTKGEILFEYINVNISMRLSPDLLLAVLNNIID